MFCVLLQKNKTFLRSFTFFAKERNVLCVLLRSLQKNVTFFYVLCKRTLRSFTVLRKERKRMYHSFGSHKSPKTRKKERKRTMRSLKERKRTMCSVWKRTRCPTLVGSSKHLVQVTSSNDH